jgi:hypothetical protein
MSFVITHAASNPSTYRHPSLCVLNSLHDTGCILQLKALNYAPGPMDTVMQGEVRDNNNADQNGRQWFLDMHKEVRT